MTDAIIKSYKQSELNTAIKGAILRHPYVALSAMFIIVPLLMLLAVGITSGAIILPISLLCGWI